MWRSLISSEMVMPYDEVLDKLTLCVEVFSLRSEVADPMDCVDDFERLWRLSIKDAAGNVVYGPGTRLGILIKGLRDELNALAVRDDAYRLFDDDAFVEAPEWNSVRQRAGEILDVLRAQ